MKSVKTLISYCLLVAILSGANTTGNAQTVSSNSSIEKTITGQGYRKIALKRMISGHLFMEATINGVKGSFFLDTGAGATVLDNGVKEKFKANAEQSAVTGVGAGGDNLNIQASAGNKFESGGYHNDNYTLYFTRLDHVNNALKQMGLSEIDGVLGADFLTLTKAIIDYSTMTLYVHP